LRGADRKANAAPISVASLAAELESVVREAGTLALETFRKSPRQWAKGMTSVVSEADIAVDDFLHRRLAAAAPGFGWLSEETEDDPARLGADHVWIVDPIDGTRAYLAGQPDWTVSVALASAGRPVLAALFAPVTQEMFLARAGSGATLNGTSIQASPGSGLGGARAAGPKRFLQQLADHDPKVVAMPRIGSLALRFARVAHGQFDICIAGGNSHDWDLAAADLLVHEAGGTLTSFVGEPIIYNRPRPVHGSLIAAGQARHAKLLGLMRDD
jgi:myo-inositol-1(or 4)-monophosphatase